MVVASAARGESVTAAACRKNNDQLKRVISRMDAEAAEAARRVRKAEEDAAELRIELENRPTAQDYQKAQRTIFNLQSKISAEEDAVEEERVPRAREEAWPVQTGITNV